MSSHEISHPTFSTYDDWTLIKLLGSGIYGNVWKASSRNGEIMAIKFIAANDNDYETSGYSKFTLADIIIPLSLSHPNIVKYISIIKPFRIPRDSKLVEFNIDEEDDDSAVGIWVDSMVFGIVMPLAKGDLTHVISTEPSMIHSNFYVMREMVEAVCYLTSHNIIHGDIKPANFLYTDEYEIQLTDFGLAIAGACYGLNASYNLYSPFYRPPELWIDTDYSRGPYSDVWALGVTLYEMYTGSVPFEIGKSKRTMNDHILLDMLSKLDRPSSTSSIGRVLKLKYPSQWNARKVSDPFNQIKNDRVKRVISGMLKIDPDERMTIFEVQRTLMREDDSPEKMTPYIECMARPSLFRRQLNLSIMQSDESSTIHNAQRWMLNLMGIMKFSDLNMYFIAIQIMYRYLSIHPDKMSSLKLVALTSLITADKFINVAPAWMSDYVFEADMIGWDRSIVELQAAMLSAIEYDLMASTPFDIIQSYNDVFDSDIIQYAGNILAQVSLTDYYFEQDEGRYVYRSGLPENCLIMAAIGHVEDIPLGSLLKDDIQLGIQRAVETSIGEDSIGLRLSRRTWNRILEHNRHFKEDDRL